MKKLEWLVLLQSRLWKGYLFCRRRHNFFITAHKRSLWQGNVSTCVCHSVPWGVCVPPPSHKCLAPATHTPLPHMKPCHPQPPAVHIPPLCHARPTPLQSMPNPRRYHEMQSMSMRTLRILLECILVLVLDHKINELKCTTANICYKINIAKMLH